MMTPIAHKQEEGGGGYINQKVKATIGMSPFNRMSFGFFLFLNSKTFQHMNRERDGVRLAALVGLLQVIRELLR